MSLDTLYYIGLGAVVLCMTFFSYRLSFFRKDFHSLLSYDLKVDVSINNNEDEKSSPQVNFFSSSTDGSTNESEEFQMEDLTHITVDSTKAIEHFSEDDVDSDDNLDIMTEFVSMI